MRVLKTILGLLGVLMVVGAVVVGIWLCIWVMLYGGIMQAVNNWGTNNPAVVWGIIRAVFFELGAIPAYLLGFLGIVICGASAALE